MIDHSIKTLTAEHCMQQEQLCPARCCCSAVVRRFPLLWSEPCHTHMPTDLFPEFVEHLQCIVPAGHMRSMSEQQACGDVQ
jgi:hypothetical protein